MKQSLRERLREYLGRRHTEWVASGFLQRLVSEKTSYSPQNTGRRLRELAEDGDLEVKYIGNHAYYRAKSPHTPSKKEEIVIKGCGQLKSYEQLKLEGVVD